MRFGRKPKGEELELAAEPEVEAEEELEFEPLRERLWEILEELNAYEGEAARFVNDTRRALMNVLRGRFPDEDGLPREVWQARVAAREDRVRAMPTTTA